ncbi:hypothetical protein TKK_0016526 [Trichogramma kaykai]|uniref:Uncharacterized protein n=1 Tax=Trichogramma kaykai TaxID=54128 RepID=A0ABD2W5W0_9HYME
MWHSCLTSPMRCDFYLESKSATLHLKGVATAKVRDTRFSIQGSEMRSMQEGEAYKHLGVPSGFQARKTPDSSIKGFVDDLCNLDQSLLVPLQKFEVTTTFILP